MALHSVLLVLTQQASGASVYVVSDYCHRRTGIALILHEEISRMGVVDPHPASGSVDDKSMLRRISPAVRASFPELSSKWHFLMQPDQPVLKLCKIYACLAVNNSLE